VVGSFFTFFKALQEAGNRNEKRSIADEERGCYVTEESLEFKSGFRGVGVVEIIILVMYNKNIWSGDI